MLRNCYKRKKNSKYSFKIGFEVLREVEIAEEIAYELTNYRLKSGTRNLLRKRRETIKRKIKLSSTVQDYQEPYEGRYERR